MPPVPPYYHGWLRKAHANARTLRSIMRRWFIGQSNKKTLQLLGIPQQQEQHFLYSGRRLRREHILAIAETEATRRKEIDRAAERILERTRKRVESWRQRRHADITKLTFDLRSLADKIDYQIDNDLDFLLTETRKKILTEKRESAIERKLLRSFENPPLPTYDPLWHGHVPDVSSEMLEDFPLYETEPPRSGN